MNLTKQSMKEMNDLFNGLYRYLDEKDELWNRVHYSVIEETIIYEISRVLGIVVVDGKERFPNV